jgi:hypothetical protein
MFSRGAWIIVKSVTGIPAVNHAQDARATLKLIKKQSLPKLKVRE